MDNNYETMISRPSKGKRCNNCGHVYGHCLKCMFCGHNGNGGPRKPRAKINTGGGRKPRPTFKIDGVEHFKCIACKKNRSIGCRGYAMSWKCKACTIIEANRNRKRRLRFESARRISWTQSLKREAATLESKDLLAMGFDAARDGKENKKIPGTVAWYLFHEGMMMSASREPYAFKPLPEDEPHNPAGMSGQRVTTFYKRSRKRYRFGTKKIDEDDESMFGY